MTSNLSLNIFRLLRKKTKSTSIRRLERRGLKNVSVLNLKDLKHLIQDAVDHSLSQLGITISPEDIKQVNEKTREQLLKIMMDRNELEASVKYMAKELDTLKDNSLALKTELEVNQRLLETEEAHLKNPDRSVLPINNSPSMETSLEERFRDLFSKHNIEKDVQNQAIRTTLELIAMEREKALESSKLSHESKVNNLRRRINKLNAKLAETEDLLYRAQTESLVETGEASEFRTVQGLSDTVKFREEKKILLQEIFNLNKDLKTMMASEDL